ncbi:hypothetical protein [Amycolatopsis cihanbeyliensis]|uniref:Uncharacterized protein n=1 Tax=Amycolatopsis cihanbeyliensis TaxID=1128664 RepID=A0A542DEN1_AMYCI|nr:hypothetical protein [Amycolatopsis cihanbeyliensis]TQJ01531.1 hypothetical protein FB471_1219 [Amycolatopsis cihanbeyliensis]
MERRLAELHLDRGGAATAGAVLDAVAAYRNPDGGLGHGLEPDVRAPASQPLAVDFGLELVGQVLGSAAGADDTVRDRARALAEGLLPFLASVATADGGLPIVLPSVAAHPRAEHWGDGRFPAGLNPTAGVVARLRMAALAAAGAGRGAGVARGTHPQRAPGARRERPLTSRGRPPLPRGGQLRRCWSARKCAISAVAG